MRDYRKRYQSIKDKGEELGITFSQVINKERYLYFKENAYMNFSTLPLEAYLSLEAKEKETKDTTKGLFPMLSTIGSIIPTEEKDIYSGVGYRVLLSIYLGETIELGTKRKKRSYFGSFYLPIELAYLLNPFNEKTIEETLARYLISLFKLRNADKEKLIEEIKQDFNKYAFILNAMFGNGYPLEATPQELLGLLDAFTEKKGKYKKGIENELKETKERLNRFLNDLEMVTGKPLGKQEPTFTKEAIEGLTKLADSAAAKVPSFKEIEAFKTERNAKSLKHIFTDVSFIYANQSDIRELTTQIEEAKEIASSKEVFSSYEKVYFSLLELFKKKRKSSAEIYTEKNPSEVKTPIYVPGETPSLEILKALQDYSDTSNKEDLAYIALFNEKKKKWELLNNEINADMQNLYKEQQENGYHTPTAKKIDIVLRGKINERNEIEAWLDNETGKEEINWLPSDIYRNDEKENKAYCTPKGFFTANGLIYKGYSNEITTYQVTSSEAICVVSKNTVLRGATDTLAKYRPMTRKVLSYIMMKAVQKNSPKFMIEKNEIERLVLADRYKNATLKERDNARNITFLEALVLLSRTTLEVSYDPSEKALKKGYKPRAFGGGSVISYERNGNEGYNISIDDKIYLISIKDFPINPTTKNIYELRPRAFLTALYLYSQCATNYTNKRTLTFETLLNAIPSYSALRKYLGQNTGKIYKTICEDFQEMKEKGVVTDYKKEDNGSLYFKMNIKPQRKRGKDKKETEAAETSSSND